VVETPVWVGGSLAITVVAVVDELIAPLRGGWRVPVALSFVWVTVALAAIPLRLGKRVPRAGALAQVALLGFFTVTVMLHGARHGVQGLTAADLAPSWAIFVVVAPVLVYNFLGFELPSTASDELRDPARDVPTSIVRAGWMTCALYAVPVLAIVLVVPPEQLTGLTGFVKALAGVFVVYGSWAGPVGAVVAAAFIWVLIANGLTWTMGASRTQVAAGRDGIGPAALAGVSARTGTPVAASLLGGAVATATTLAAFAVGGRIDTAYLEQELARHARRPLRIGSFSAASNVTGVISDTDAISELLHRHGTLACWDFAAAGPHLEIAMRRRRDHPLTYKDALFLSPHKFPGGPGTPGVLVVCRELVRNRVPTVRGGGTITYVHATGQHYLADPSYREERSNPAIEVLGDPEADRLPIVSFVVRTPAGRRLHHNFVVALLNDLFGIQARGGCSCAGPYGHRLLGIDLIRANHFAAMANDGWLGIKPGWTRLSFSHYLSELVFDDIVKAVHRVATHGARMLPRRPLRPPHRPLAPAPRRPAGGQPAPAHVGGRRAAARAASPPRPHARAGQRVGRSPAPRRGHPGRPTGPQRRPRGHARRSARTLPPAPLVRAPPGLPEATPDEQPRP
jgi:Amino acid permease/Aminotransferase class-V